MGGEDAGAVTIITQLDFNGIPGPILHSDYREADIADDDVKTALNTHSANVSEDFDIPSARRIVDVAVAY